MEIGHNYLIDEKYNQAIPYFKKSLELLENNETKEAQLLIINCQYAIGEAYFALNKVDEALERFNTAFDQIKFHGENNPLMLTKLFEKLALVHTNKNEHKTALGYFIKSMEIKKEKGDSDQISLVESMSNISKSYFEMGNTFQSIEYYNKSITLLENWVNKTTQQDYSVIKVRVNIAPLQYVLKRFDDCAENLEKAEEIIKSFQESKSDFKKKAAEDAISIKFWKGGLKLALEQSDEAFDCYKAALDLSLKHYGEFHPKFQTLYANVYKIHFIAGKKFERLNSKA